MIGRLSYVFLPIFIALILAITLVPSKVLAWQKDGGISCNYVFASIKNESQTRNWDGYVKANSTTVVSNSGTASPSQWVTVSWTPTPGFSGSVEAYVRIKKQNGQTDDYKKVTGNLNCAPAPSPSPSPTPTPTPSPSPTPTPDPCIEEEEDDYNNHENYINYNYYDDEPSPTPCPSPSPTPVPSPTPTPTPPTGGGPGGNGGAQAPQCPIDGKPQTIDQVWLSDITPTTVIVHWAIKGDATAYQLAYGPEQNKWLWGVKVEGGNVNSYQLKDLPQNTKIFVSVIPLNGNCSGDSSASFGQPSTLAAAGTIKTQALALTGFSLVALGLWQAQNALRKNKITSK